MSAATTNNMEMAIHRFTGKMEVLLEMERQAELEESALILNKFSLKVSGIKSNVKSCLCAGT